MRRSRRAARSTASCRTRRRCSRRRKRNYGAGAELIDYTDGLSVDFENWRFNLRASNTEPLVRLNVESRGDEALMREKTAELLAFLDSMGAVKPHAINGDIPRFPSKRGRASIALHDFRGVTNEIASCLPGIPRRKMTLAC